MHMMRSNAPTPHLRIVPTESVHPHEEHDDQRAKPLIARIRKAEKFINPPIVAPMNDQDEYVVLDGANRCYAFQYLEYPHILVQSVAYDSEYVELSTWHHIISDWDSETFLTGIEKLADIQLSPISEVAKSSVATIRFRDGSIFNITTSASTTQERSAVLRQFVRLYRENAVLYRTAIGNTQDIWTLYPRAIALVEFASYQPEDIITAAREHAFLPPGISRHIIQGRALKLNYPLALLRNEHTDLDEKNHALQSWFQARLRNRQVRYYAESTYQFDE